ncbi:hypothetical protein CC80DRAFT_535037 [Byssothecium circinans]|uniref:Uncharacterized protein n=1 Tax=Byssothecium circinans TaxID=147558 RepID=A0A6A5TWR5_9PLEO|nr:hypothetical protein CC80DRAFT_535037 [Byssothecium circinans]
MGLGLGVGIKAIISVVLVLSFLLQPSSLESCYYIYEGFIYQSILPLSNDSDPHPTPNTVELSKMKERDNDHSSNEEFEEDTKAHQQEVDWKRPADELSYPKRPRSTVTTWVPVRVEWAVHMLIYFDMKGSWYCPKHPLHIEDDPQHYADAENRDGRRSVVEDDEQRRNFQTYMGPGRQEDHLYYDAIAGKDAAYHINPLST